MDKLGGILTKGLLGNLILARFNLFLEVIIEIVPPTPSPMPLSHRGGGGGRYPDDYQRTIKITVRYKDKEYITVKHVDDKILQVSINILNRITHIKDSTLSVMVKLRNKLIDIKVFLNGNRH